MQYVAGAGIGHQTVHSADNLRYEAQIGNVADDVKNLLPKRVSVCQRFLFYGGGVFAQLFGIGVQTEIEEDKIKLIFALQCGLQRLEDVTRIGTTLKVVMGVQRFIQLLPHFLHQLFQQCRLADAAYAVIVDDTDILVLIGQVVHRRIVLLPKGASGLLAIGENACSLYLCGKFVSFHYFTSFCCFV